jgi:hypothetical protein
MAAIASRPVVHEPARRWPAAMPFGLVRDVVIATALFVIAAFVLLRAVETVPFHGDESEWINAGRYFKFVFLDHDLTGSVWRPSWLNRDQPPVGRYVIGGIVWASGNHPDQVNRSYAWERDYAANLTEGRVPGPALLQPVRRTMAVVGALSIVLLFVAGRLVGGTVAGVVAALSATFSPLLQLYFVQARTEALLAFISALILVLVLLVARRFQHDGNVRRVGWLVGPLLGLALATKLTAALAIVAVCAYGAVAALAHWRTSRTESSRLLVWAIATGALASVVWVVVNPFLWGDPVGRTWSMLEQQQSIMLEQGVQFGNPVEVRFPQRVGLLVYRTFVENSTPAFDAGRAPGSEPLIRRTFLELPAPFGVSAELTLAALGLGMLITRVARAWRSDQRHGVEHALLWWLGVYALGIAANLSLDWPRYYVPTAFFGTLLIGLGVAEVVALARRLTSGRFRQAPLFPEHRTSAAG